MKLLLFLAVLFISFEVSAQTYDFNRSFVEVMDTKGNVDINYTSKSVCVQISKDTIIYFEIVDSICHQPKDTFKVAHVVTGKYGIFYIINKEHYFATYPARIVHMRKVGKNMIFETLIKNKED